jgi:hypothetical protein
MEAHILQAKTRHEIADEYGISVKTLHRRLKKADINLSKGIIMPKDVIIIYRAFGVPKNPKKS